MANCLLASVIGGIIDGIDGFVRFALVREDQAGPVVVFFLLCQVQAEGGGSFCEQGDVGGIEATEDKACARGHLLAESGHVGQENVAVDIGQDEVEMSLHLI